MTHRIKTPLSTMISLDCGCLVRVCQCPRKDTHAVTTCRHAENLLKRFDELAEVKDRKKRASVMDQYRNHIDRARDV